MSTTTIRFLGIFFPVLLWMVLTALRIYLAPAAPPVAEAALELLLVALGGAFFANQVANRFDRHNREADERARQLESLRQAAMALTTELELRSVLQKVVDLSRTLGGARYAALGVLDSTGVRIDEFISQGITPEERARMGDLPQGHGLLGAILAERRPMRVDAMQADPRSVGFPPHHPPMSTLLGVPILSKGRVFGNLYLTDKVNPNGGAALPFTDQDQRTLEMFAAHAAVAIENARLHSQNQQIAIMQERERFGMNLHDGVIQSIYAIGLILDDARHRMEGDPALARKRIDGALTGLDEVIRDIRSYIMDLRPERFDGRSLQDSLHAIAALIREHGELPIEMHIDAAAAALATPRQTSELLHIVNEALTNIQKHAAAQHVVLHLRREGDQMVLAIEDDGCGFDVFRAAGRAKGHGLRNMQERARTLNGELEVESEVGHGTHILLTIPLRSSPNPA